MKSSTKKILLIEFIMLIVIVSNFFIPYLFKDYKYLIFLLFSGVAVYLTVGIDINKSVKQKSIMKNLIIYLLLFFIITFLSGLFIGFNRTIYSYTMSNLVKNILPAVTIILVSEILRYELIRKTDNNKLVIVVTFFVFLLLDLCISFYNYDLTIQDQIYEYIGLVILGGIAKGILMTLFDVKVDFYPAILYRLIMELYIFLLPIVPAFGPYLNSVISIVFPILICFMVIKSLRSTVIEKPKEKKKSNLIYMIVLGILLILVGLNSGFFKYQILVIGSNSMQNYMSRGDVVLIEKLSNKEKKELVKGQILVFKYDGKIIVHRIYKVDKKPSGVYFTTKGDNNSQVDASVINEEKTIGVVRQRYKSIGLPSIWVSDLFN